MGLGRVHGRSGAESKLDKGSSISDTVVVCRATAGLCTAYRGFWNVVLHD